jgi:2,4-dienoyl-CoA reductase-like NADH-dependent reductase (Old Yellow Enzyme family)
MYMQVGNGDVVSINRAHELLQETNCSAIMLGRGAVQDPLLFHRIRLSFTHPDDVPWEWDEPEAVCAFLRVYTQQAFQVGINNSSISDDQGQGDEANRAPGSSLMTERGKFGCMKKVRFAFL